MRGDALYEPGITTIIIQNTQRFLRNGLHCHYLARYSGIYFRLNLLIFISLSALRFCEDFESQLEYVIISAHIHAQVVC